MDFTLSNKHGKTVFIHENVFILLQFSHKKLNIKFMESWHRLHNIESI